jgi:peroxiredoxin
VSKTALRNSLYGWLAMMFVALVVSLIPAKVPAWQLPTSSGTTGSLRDLEGKPVGLLLYSSKVQCGAHTRALADAVQIREMLKESPRYSVKIVYGEKTEAGARALAAGHKDVPILLDPAKKLADELDVGSYAIVLYKPNGRIIELQKDRVLVAQPGLQQYLDGLTQ